MEAVAPQVVGRYAIYGKIASGGMASVHFGRLLGGAGFSRTVAIKRLHPHLAEDPEFLSTMIDEARLAARIHHPNVVPTLDVVAAGGELLLVMEYVRGEALSRLVKIEAARGRVVPLPITSAIALGALHGLHAAHEATSDHGEPLGIVHRDVSPQNILVGVDGLSRVIDFGIAKAAGRLQMTREGTVKGKIAYMAPEQLGGVEVTRAADIYAMGVVLWEALTGQRLFSSDSDAALAMMVVNGAKDPPSMHGPRGMIPPGLDALVMKALSRNPARRFNTAREMAELLTRIVPPALPTDVGDWCQEAASDLLEKRGLVLSEIESSSGVAPIVPSSPSNPDHDSQSNRSVPVQRVSHHELGTRVERVRDAPRDDAELAPQRLSRPGPEPTPAPSLVPTGPQRLRVSAMSLLAESGDLPDDDAAHVASKPSNLSLAAYTSPDVQAWWSRPQLVGALGGGIVLGLVVAVGVWMASRSAASPQPGLVAARAPVPGASAPAAPPAPPRTSAAAPLPMTSVAVPTQSWTTLEPAGGAPTPMPNETRPSRHGGGGRPSHHAAPVVDPANEPAAPDGPPTAPMVVVTQAPPPPPPPASKDPNCNPSFTIDADGTKHFKPECFAK